jgi:hypothetical protein
MRATPPNGFVLVTASLISLAAVHVVLQHSLVHYSGAVRLAPIRKTRFSNRTRFVFVAGLEGTGHHLLGQAFHATVGGVPSPVVDAATLRCRLYEWGPKRKEHSQAEGQEEDDDELVAWIFPPARRPPRGKGIFQLAHDPELEVRAKLLQEALAATAAQGQPDRDHDTGELTVMALNTVDGEREGSKMCLSGMMSYPNFRWENPDIALLARIAEDAGVDLRIVVLTRSSLQTIASTLRRGFHNYSRARGSPFATNAAVLIESAHALQRQVNPQP